MGTMIYELDEDVNAQIAAELIRITRRGGRIFLGAIQDTWNVSPNPWIHKNAYTGGLNRLRLLDVAKRSGAEVLAIGTDHEWYEGDMTFATDRWYSAVLRRL